MPVYRSEVADWQISLPKKWLYLFAFSFNLLMGAFAIVYLLLPYHSLCHFYLSLGDCFYKHARWTTDFFTPATKTAGNYWCIASILFIIPTSLHVIYKILQNRRNPVVFHGSLLPAKPLRWPVLGLLAAAFALWYWGNTLVLPANDEMFSAVSCAGMHPLQTWSYYMLPNNHVLFNILNGVFFHTAFDKVATGRVISLLAYLSVTMIVFRWLYIISASRLFSGVATLLIIFQLPVWSFGFQARGYELYLLAEWVTFIALFYYWQRGNRRWLAISLIASVCGYAVLPSFLYFHAAIIAIAVLLQIRQRKRDIAFWKYQLLCFGFVFLFYLPVLCFSGFGALAENKYVRPGADSISSFATTLWPTLQYFISACYIGTFSKADAAPYLLLLLPLPALLPWKSRSLRFTGLMFVAMWLMFIALSLVMKRVPFPRNLIGQFSISLACSLFMLRKITAGVANRVRQPFIAWLLWLPLTILLGVHLFKDNRQSISSALYGSDVNEPFRSTKASLPPIPPGKSVSIPDSNFAEQYIYSRERCTISGCFNGHEDYVLLNNDAPAPATLLQQYFILKKGNAFTVYRRK